MLAASSPIHLPVYLPHRSCEPRKRLALASSPSPQRSTVDLQDTQSHLQQTPFPTTQEASRGPGAQEPQEKYQLREGVSNCQEHLKRMRKTLLRQGYQPSQPRG